MTIAPIIRRVTVKASPAHAFELFSSRMHAWWPEGMTIGEKPRAEIVIEPRVGGAWFERGQAGRQTQWGDVLAWEPPSRLLLAWRINSQWTYDPGLTTEVELTFVAAPGGTEVTLEHRNLERFGASAAQHAESLGSGWPGILAAYAQFTDTQT
jgi:uncharacterized protein YndB with AHSA1/START domain